MLGKGEPPIVNELQFEKWVYGGEALARQEGRVVLAPFILPGEKARIEPVSEKPSLVRARLKEIVEAGPERIQPKCRHFAICGGCHYQHAPYEFQVARKVEILGEVLRRVGKLEPPPEIAVVTGPEWEYRNRVQLHIDGSRIGFHEAGSHRVRGVDHCRISSPKLNESITVLHDLARNRRWPKFLKTLELFTHETEVQVNALDSGTRRLSRGFFEWCAERIPGALSPSLDYHASGELFRVSHQSFFQVNRFLVEKLVETALEGAEGSTGLDLYAGVGLFSLRLARRGMKVTAVESGASAITDLEYNALRAGVEVHAVRMQSEQYLESLTARPDFVLADPPRAGLGKHVVRRLADLKPRRITVVSCDASTLARDLAALVSAGYRLEALSLVDLFPQTAHIESVARLATP
ncbi:MAG: class I SAM-dependent RNA methyltransferase [Acidimicrobiia bacterium]|nr:class I SAM-dependent RNA methyltransferase [Acidimicrobiia bacterium]